jgi:hypothetical protein
MSLVHRSKRSNCTIVEQTEVDVNNVQQITVSFTNVVSQSATIVPHILQLISDEEDKENISSDNSMYSHSASALTVLVQSPEHLRN